MIWKLLAIERIKAFNYNSFWIILALFTALIILAFFVAGAFGTVTVGNEDVNLPQVTIYEFPLLWHYLVYISGFLHYLPALLVILLVTNDIQHGIWRQHVAEGLDRSELVGSKILLTAILALYATVLLIIIGLFFGLRNTMDANTAVVLENASFLIGYFVQLFGYLTIAFVFAVLVKRPAQAIIFLLVYGIILERIIRYFLPDELSFYLPMAAITGIVSNPYMSLIGVEVVDTPFISNFYVSLAWILILWGGIYAFIRYKDL